MRNRILLKAICFAAILALPILIGCKKAAKGVIVVNNGEAKLVTMKIGDNGEIPPMWESGWVVLFRTDGKIPGGEAGKAGEAYMIDENKKLQKLGNFDVKKSDQELAKEYQ